MRIIHDLKCWPQFFRPLFDGDKTFEVRRRDRDFKVGDVLCIKEWVPELDCYTGREVERTITYIMAGDQFGIDAAYCVLGLALVGSATPGGVG